MDLLNFDAHPDHTLYFNEEIPPEVESLLQAGADAYPEGGGELPLLQAYFLAPECLAVLVSLYRYYFYRHQHERALVVARRALARTATRLEWPDDWRQLTPQHLEDRPLPLIRFHLMALKGAAYLQLRLGAIDEARAMLDILMSLDPHDRLGAAALDQVAAEHGPSRG